MHRLTVHGVDVGCVVEEGGVCSEETNGTGTEDSDSVSWLEAGIVDGAPASGEDVAGG